MKVIYKYPLNKLLTRQTLTLPEGSEVLSVIQQRDTVVVYALVDDTLMPAVDFDFFIVPTGLGMPLMHSRAKFLGTVSLHNGNFILHVFYHDRRLRGV